MQCLAWRAGATCPGHQRRNVAEFVRIPTAEAGRPKLLRVQLRRVGFLPPLTLTLLAAMAVASAFLPPLPTHPLAREPADTTAPISTEPVSIGPVGDERGGDARGPNLEPVEFDGVLPGVSTIAEVHEAWGEPTRTSEKAGVVHHVYAREPFARLEAMFHKGKVLSIAVQFEESLPAVAVAEQLRLTVEPVTSCDAAGKPIAILFPERGATFRLAPHSGIRETSDLPQDERDSHEFGDLLRPHLVREIVLGEIDAGTFVLRAENCYTTRDTRALVDLETALDLDGKRGRALWLRACLLMNSGQRREALAAVDQALRVEPKRPEYKLTRARILADSCRFDEAAAEIEQAITHCGQLPQVKALALSRAGELSAAGPSRDFQRCVELAQQAIRLAEPLASDRRLAVARTAREALIEAHLAAAHGTAWGRWKNKREAVALWLAKAQTIAQESIEEHGLDPDWGLRVCSRALGASVGAGGKIDPSQWAEQALQIGRDRIEATDDPLHRRRLAWELGLALYDALQAFQTRREFDPALEYGRLAVSYLDQGRVGRDEAPGDAYLFGRLYFRIGLIHAEHRHEHGEAVEWYEKAVPLIEQPVPDSALADVGRPPNHPPRPPAARAAGGRQGESLAAAAVSYWQTGDREKAVRLTRRSAELMEQAVEQDILSGKALSVVYSNLASMHRALGEQEKAESYALMASKLERK